MVHINHFVIKGHRAALKKFKACLYTGVITVDTAGGIECIPSESWYRMPGQARVDRIACQLYHVSSDKLTETMVKNTAVKILKGEL